MNGKKIFSVKICKGCGALWRHGEWVKVENSYSAFMARLLQQNPESILEITVFKDSCSHCEVQTAVPV